MIIEKEIKMLINQYNVDYYQDKLNKQLKIGQWITIPVEFLPPTSGVKITTQCEYCGKIFTKAYRKYIESKDRGKICCNECRNIKIRESCLQKYGVDCTLKVPEFKEKMEQNNLKKYGTKHSVTPESIQKRKKVCLEKYGFEYAMSNKDIQAKRNATLYLLGKDSHVYTSIQQKHINEIVHGELNYPVGPYHIDSYLIDEQIGIEYSGSGHALSVKLGNETEASFLRKEKARHSYFVNHKIPIIEIFSQTDKLPSDEKLLQIISNAIDNINSQSLLYIKIDLDNILL